MDVSDLKFAELRTFAGLHAALHATTENQRDKARRALGKWLRKRGLTTNDIPAIFARWHQVNAASSPPPPDPRNADPSNPFAGTSITPADVVYKLICRYVMLRSINWSLPRYGSCTRTYLIGFSLRRAAI